MELTHRLNAGAAGGIALLAALATLLALFPLATPASAASTTRLSAMDNVGASLAWSQVAFNDGTAPEALLGRDDLFADSLASGAAQGALNAPLLLTDGDLIDPRVLIEFQRLGTSKVVILGGDVAISDGVEAQVRAAGFETSRVSGATRIETAIAIKDRFFPSATQAVVARAFAGNDPTQAFADSLASGAFSAGTAIPILFTETDRLTGNTRAALEGSDIVRVTIAGGGAAVSDAVAAEIRSLGIEVVRVSGSNRAGTAVAMSVDRGFASAARAERIILTEGATPDAWADGFAAAVQSAGSGAPLVLSANAGIPGETRAFLSDGNGRIDLVCGPFVEASACTAASQELGNE
jgi:putative cell wall-binding protein